MAITATQTQDGGPVQRAVGRYIQSATAAAFTIVCGFKPRYVKVVNVTSRDMMEFYEGMTDAYGIKTVAAGTRTLASTNGITLTSDGFTVGLDTDVNVTAEQISWYALG